MRIARGRHVSGLEDTRLSISFFFFFFQAEDGIRDVAVTGVQTCALPISLSPASTTSSPSFRPPHPFASAQESHPALAGSLSVWMRSEEHTSELQSRLHLVCRLLLEKKKDHVERLPHRSTEIR